MIKFIIVGKKWFDKANGNTYHSARVFDLEKKVIAVAPFQYGYHDQFIQSATEALQKSGKFDGIMLKHDEYIAIDGGYTKQRDVKYWGELKF